MQVTSITEFRTAPGTYLEWPVSLGDGEPSDVPASFNQSFHLADALESGEHTTPTVWIAAAFDVEGHVDVDALTSSFTDFVTRHPALRTTFHASDDRIGRRIHPVSEVHLDRPNAYIVSTATQVSEHVRRRLNHLCHPTRVPSYSFAAIDRPDRSTILVGFDHAHVDAVSMTVAVEEISAIYEAEREGRATDLDVAGSFVDYCALESEAPEVPASDPRIRAWAEFVADCGGSTPTFPFDLGVPVGERAPQATTVHRLASADETEAFENNCRALGGGMFAGVTAAMAQASANIGGPQQLPLLFPLHTRRDEQWAEAIGWFTTNAPMKVTVGPEFADTFASACASFRAALPLGTVPVPRFLGALGENFSRTRQDVFMISYIDYCGLPGAKAEDRNAHHISNVTTADDAQFWISRTADGLSLRSRFPDTVLAHAVVGSFVENLITVVRHTLVAARDSSELSLVGPSA